MTDQDKFSLANLFAMLTAASGGILFGYHTGIISGILISIKTIFNLSTFDEGFLVSIVLLGGLLGALCAGTAADRWGRKKMLLATAFIFCVGTLIQATAYTYIELLGGRLLTGIGIGISSVVSPLYLAEIAPARFRGGFVSMYQLLIAGGILLAYGINLLFDATLGWRSVFYMGFIPSAVQLTALFFIPETPGWLMGHSKKIETIQTLAGLRQDVKWVYQAQEMRKTAAFKIKGTFNQLFIPPFRRLFIVGLVLSIFQQITGVNTVFYYAPKIFLQKGVDFSLWITFLIGVTNFVFTIFSVLLLDKLGRRFFLLTGLTAMILGQILLIFAATSPMIGIIGALIYVFGFAIGLGPITWVLLSEIYPLKIRGKAIGLAIFANWLFNYIVSLTFLLLIEHLGMNITFMLYGIISIFCLIFIYFFIPETKGKSLEEIEFLATKGQL